METKMNMRKTFGSNTLFLIILVLPLMIGCIDAITGTLKENTGSDSESSDIDINVNAPIDTNVYAANTDFAFNLFNEIWQEEQNQNIFISPFSVSVALAMTLNGASGETEQAMVETLQLQNIEDDSINPSFQQLQQTLLNSDKKVTLTIANSLWGDEGVSFNPTFLQRNTQFFNAEVSILDFLAQNSLMRINQWVNDNTNGKIPQILDAIEPNAVLFLINAIYFKGAWKEEFDPEHTRDGTFHITSNTNKQVSMMFRQGSYSHYRADEFEAVSLPYGDGRISMYVFLPNPDSNLNAFLETLDVETWEDSMSQFQERQLALRIPKFKIEYGTKELNDALTNLGMGIAFDQNRADFSRMASIGSGNLYIDKVSHKTFIEVNEEGTEAAAVTVVGIVKTSLPPQFTVNRPFFFAIRDNETGTVLFMGTVVEP